MGSVQVSAAESGEYREERLDIAILILEILIPGKKCITYRLAQGPEPKTRKQGQGLMT